MYLYIFHRPRNNRATDHCPGFFIAILVFKKGVFHTGLVGLGAYLLLRGPCSPLHHQEPPSPLQHAPFLPADPSLSVAVKAKRGCLLSQPSWTN